MNIKNKLTEEEAREFAKNYNDFSCTYCERKVNIKCNKNLDCMYYFLKQSGIIQKSKYEELMEYVEKIICVSTKDIDKDNSGLKHLIQAYHDEKHSLSPAVKEAREKTFNALFDYIIRILSTIPGVDTDKLNQLVQDVIQSERNAADKE